MNHLGYNPYAGGQVGYNPYTGMVGTSPTPPPTTGLTPEQLSQLCEQGNKLGKVYAEQGYEAAFAEAQKMTNAGTAVAVVTKDPKAMDYLAQCMLNGYYEARKAKEVGYKPYLIGAGAGVLLGLIGGYFIGKR
jgi:hypothetical protein